MSRKRDFERMARKRLVAERGPAEPTPRGPKIIPDGLAEKRGWVRPAVKDWNRNDWMKPP
jgi:hypothetical protein